MFGLTACLVDESATQGFDQTPTIDTVEFAEPTAEPQPTPRPESTLEPAAAPTDEPESTVEPEATTASSPTAASLALPGERSVWTGTIDGSIGVEIWLAQHDEFLRGEIVYTSVGEPITLLGRQYSDSGDVYSYLQEFGSDARVSGSITLEGGNDGVFDSATWGELDLELEYQGVDDQPYFFDPLVREGDYRYAFPPFGDFGTECCGPEGNLAISNVTDSTLTVEFANVTSGPAFNQALLQPVEIELDDNRARFEALDGDFIDCEFEIVVFDGFAFVDYLNDRFRCGFGNNAGVSGNYVMPGGFG